MERLGTETAFEVLVKAKALEAQGRDIIHLEIGEPDFDTPSNIIEAGCDALRKGFTHYGPSAGMTESFPAASRSSFFPFWPSPKMEMKSFTRIPASRFTSR